MGDSRLVCERLVGCRRLARWVAAALNYQRVVGWQGSREFRMASAAAGDQPAACLLIVFIVVIFIIFILELIVVFKVILKAVNVIELIGINLNGV